MGVKATKEGSSYKFFICFHRYMPIIVEVLFTQTKIDNINLLIGAFHHEISRFNIPIKVTFIVHLFDYFQSLSHDFQECAGRYELFGKSTYCVFLY